MCVVADSHGDLPEMVFFSLNLTHLGIGEGCQVILAVWSGRDLTHTNKAVVIHMLFISCVYLMCLSHVFISCVSHTNKVVAIHTVFISCVSHTNKVVAIHTVFISCVSHTNKVVAIHTVFISCVYLMCLSHVFLTQTRL